MLQRLGRPAQFRRERAPMHNAPRSKAAPANIALPNILLITLDTTRADRMGFLGSKRGLTPNLDDLAREAGGLHARLRAGSADVDLTMRRFSPVRIRSLTR